MSSTVVVKNNVFNDKIVPSEHDASLFCSKKYLFEEKIGRYKLNAHNKENGLILMSKIPDMAVTATFFDPQYRGVLDKLSYGNEGKSRGTGRCNLPQMSEKVIIDFIKSIDRVTKPSGHLFLWVDKFHLCEGVKDWFSDVNFSIVDMIVWDKQTFGMGYRTRRTCEFLIILQKKPIKVKDIWLTHNIRDIWAEKIMTKGHPHCKPINLQKELIISVSKEGDLILDPAMGSGSVLQASLLSNRKFIGCDLNG
ncbi:MAG: site-specific DNA-methyltransferase [Rickettsiales bacterium]|nr:site-specific DNA-methyltransferase [Rickettsiales bacterium]